MIVDGHALFGEAIRHALEQRGSEVLGVATSAADAVLVVRRHRPDVVLVDVSLPDQNGVPLGAAIHHEHPGTTILAVSAFQDADAVRDAARAGFDGFLSKDMELAEFVGAIHAALRGLKVFPAQRARIRVDGDMTREDALLADQLTAREHEVLALLSQGASSQRIAADLGITANTVRTHVQRILSKLQVHSRLEAAAFAARSGLVGSSRAGRRFLELEQVAG